MSYALNTHYKKILADTITPVSVYLKIRDRYPGSLLLESSDYHANDNSFSYICFNPIAHIEVKDQQIKKAYPDGSNTITPITKETNIPEVITAFSKEFTSEKQDFKFITQGLFGFMTYDAVQYYEDIKISKKEGGQDLPELYYAVYQNVIAINHFNNEAYIFAHCYNQPNNVAAIEQLIAVKNFATYPFKIEGEPSINIKDEDYKALVETAKKHCQRGDVFQLVLSRRFTQKFSGDEFNVYRALRAVNPSPYLFYFDYGNYKIFGSSPEAQLVVKDQKAEIHPIAGTFKRTGNDEQDAVLAKELTEDHKENAEHVMLVDLARNDLSRHGKMVTVENYREVQFFSHVIHLVSKVTGIKKADTPTMNIVADTFPAGTLSGAPKHKAMELIEKYEPTPRGYYGGAIGFMDFEGNFNHAIMIRTFLSKDHQLQYQAGAGIVAASDPESELQETYNKLGALTKALSLAEDIY
ncbi:Anthranilate synthase [Flavobacteria bacterium MS024-3C]|jgi:anthranilate synthase component 1|nr:Anthranilate synthase [Flavobacteria bacterium MS024-3C]KRO81613.1 MAG: anthranilate synthase [Polaribacter sp. BACL8 MAG-120531-bin13]KRP14525.1 MAG: anthranilate synthase [Polaribacter sp. BACL8 MAG-120419-bin8]MCO4779624.1 anthranilate synthase component I family protein [Flavobacteriaceae bacterium]MCO4853253.1 anthranilate synthase component I family protein [Flavobacteriaceae bacterium]|tara:strand:- start:1743 stop:3143 length:1401 start_codon:yes stop_codon:yes gene_type:complete